MTDFYPRPPWGGRPGVYRVLVHTPHISIHALRGEGDDFLSFDTVPDGISIHALRGEGDDVRSAFHTMNYQFLSTPSVGRATPRPYRRS